MYINNIPTIFCLMGPTASGKTDIAVELVQHLPCEIISVDSAMVYRGMDIGTAKPSAEILKKAPHRLLNIRDPSEPYSAGQFVTDALREIADIIAHNRIPLLVGGTMLYFHALQKGLAELPSADAVIRDQLLKEAEKYGWQALHDRLKKIDPEAAKRIHPNDPQRLQRALEVYALTGKPLTQLWENKFDYLSRYRMINIAVAPTDRSILHRNIFDRFQKMLKKGFVTEVKHLYDRGDLHVNLPAIRAVGYQQIWNYLASKLSYDEMQTQAVIATRQLAKRQLTWLRRWENLRWFDSQVTDCYSQILNFLQEVIPC